MPVTNDQTTLLNEILTHLVRLEWRLEQSGVLKAGRISYGSDQLRYALENNIDIAIPNQGPPITDAFLREIMDILDAIEGDPEPSFYKAEVRFGHDRRPEAIVAMQFLKLRGQYVDIIQRLGRDGAAPVEAHSLAKDPYEDERRPRE
jgi:hypothetical protein